MQQAAAGSSTAAPIGSPEAVMFEHSLIDMEKRPRSGRRWISFPVAVFIHVVAFSAVSFVSYWSVGAVAEADLMESYVIQLQLPEPEQEKPAPQPAAPQPPATPQNQAAPQQPQVPQQQQIVQPGPRIPDVIPNAADLPTAPSDGPAPGPVSPAPCPGCNGTDPNAKGPAEGDGDGPVVLRAGMKPPVILKKVEPRYTEAARKVGLQGIVIVEAVVDEHGRVAEVRVLRGLPLGLEESAVAAVKQWRFDPATTLDGRPIKVYYNLTINFRVLR